MNTIKRKIRRPFQRGEIPFEARAEPRRQGSANAAPAHARQQENHHVAMPASAVPSAGLNAPFLALPMARSESRQKTAILSGQMAPVSTALFNAISSGNNDTASSRQPAPGGSRTPTVNGGKSERKDTPPRFTGTAPFEGAGPVNALAIIDPRKLSTKRLFARHQKDMANFTRRGGAK